MPSMSAHMAVAKRVGNILNIDDSSFIKGNILPDLYDNKDNSHFKVKGNKYMVPDIKKAFNTLDISNNLYIGYLVHLLLDKYYLESFVVKYDFDVFENKDLYKDYDIINKDVVNYFNLDKEYIKKCMIDFPDDINKDKLLLNTKCLFLDVDGITKIIDKDDYIDFLENISNKIANDIKKIME